MPPSRVDGEYVLQAIYDMVVAGLNAEIDIIELERTDIELTAIPSTGFFFQAVPPDCNVNPWVLTAINSPITTDMNGMDFSSRFDMIIILAHAGVMAGAMQPEKIHKMFMRYTEAIVRLLKKNFNRLRGYSLLEITQVPQAAEVEIEPGEIIRVAGVQFTAVIA